MSDKALLQLKLDLGALVHESRADLTELRKSVARAIELLEKVDAARVETDRAILERLAGLEARAVALERLHADLAAGQRADHDVAVAGLAELKRRVADVELNVLGYLARVRA